MSGVLGFNIILPLLSGGRGESDSRRLLGSEESVKGLFLPPSFGGPGRGSMMNVGNLQDGREN
jgi:hypothetical protein